MKKTTAIVVGTVVAFSVAANVMAKNTSANFSRYFDKAGIVQDTSKGTRISQLELKPGSGFFYVVNFANELGETSSLSTLDISGKSLVKVTRRGSEEQVEVDDFVGKFNIGGLPLLVGKYGVIAMREGSNSRDPMEQVWESATEIVSAKVAPYFGKDKWAVITLTDAAGKETKLVLFVERGATKLLREFDSKKDMQ